MKKTKNINIIVKISAMLYYACISGKNSTAREIVTKNWNQNNIDILKIVRGIRQIKEPSKRLNAFKTLINSGIDINKKININEDTLLHYVCENGLHEFVDALIEVGADINKTNNDYYTPLTAAFLYEKDEVMHKLLKHSRKIHKNNFLCSLKYAYDVNLPNVKKIAKTFVCDVVEKKKRGTDTFANSLIFFIECIYGDIREAIKMVGNIKCYPISIVEIFMFSEFFNNDVILLKNLVEIGFEINSFINTNNETLLHHASIRNRYSLVEELIAINADTEIKNKFSRTPVILASMHGYNNIVGILLQKCRNKEIINQSFEIAFTHGRMATMELIANKGANINLRINGNTPLHIAVATNNYIMAELLIRLGANKSEYALNGQTAEDIALSNKDHIMFNILNKIHDTGSKEAYNRHLCKNLLNAIQQNANVNTIKSTLQDSVVKYLLTTKDKDGKTIFSTELHTTPLILAISNQETEIVELLLDAGASPEEQDSDGCTPLGLAKTNDFKEITEIISEKIAEQNDRINKKRLLYSGIKTQGTNKKQKP